MTPTMTKNVFEQLDDREHDGIEVSLLWNRSDDSLSVYVCDSRTAETFEFAIEPDRALDAFRHPFAYRECRPKLSGAAELAA